MQNKLGKLRTGALLLLWIPLSHAAPIIFNTALPIEQKLNGTALENKYIARTSIRFNF